MFLRDKYSPQKQQREQLTFRRRKEKIKNIVYALPYGNAGAHLEVFSLTDFCSYFCDLSSIAFYFGPHHPPHYFTTHQRIYSTTMHPTSYYTCCLTHTWPLLLMKLAVAFRLLNLTKKGHPRSLVTLKHVLVKKWRTKQHARPHNIFLFFLSRDLFFPLCSEKSSFRAALRKGWATSQSELKPQQKETQNT